MPLRDTLRGPRAHCRPWNPLATRRGLTGAARRSPLRDNQGSNPRPSSQMVDCVAAASPKDDASVRGGEVSTAVIAVDVEARSSREPRDILGLEGDCLRPEARMFDTETDQPSASRERAKSLSRLKGRVVPIRTVTRISSPKRNANILAARQEHFAVSDNINKMRLHHTFAALRAVKSTSWPFTDRLT